MPEQQTTSSASQTYDVAIIGAGVCGTALQYCLQRYTNVGSIALIEKEREAAQVNSAAHNNSQTLHFGDIETNYNLDKSKKVKAAADLLKNYLEQQEDADGLFVKYHKMVLGIGQEEVERLEKRYEDYKELFPDLELIGRDRIAELEPAVAEGRDPETPLVALYTPNGYTVDYGKLAKSFCRQAEKQRRAPMDSFFDAKAKVGKWDRKTKTYPIALDDGRKIRARFLAVMAGGHSLLMAKRLGYGKRYALLSVAGSFFHAERKLKGKVYTLQIKGLPFAAAHGDPEVHDQNKTRFGPTAKALPMLERHSYRSIPEYLRTVGLSLRAAASVLKILAQPKIFRFVVTNLLYDLPYLGKRLFLPKLQRIVPTLQASDLEYAKGWGGVRPQIVDTKKMELDMGEAKIEGDHALFNVTPSPGASVCLRGAADDAQAIVKDLGPDFVFDKQLFEDELVHPPPTPAHGK